MLDNDPKHQILHLYTLTRGSVLTKLRWIESKNEPEAYFEQPNINTHTVCLVRNQKRLFGVNQCKACTVGATGGQAENRQLWISQGISRDKANKSTY